MRIKLRNLGVLALAVGAMTACADDLAVGNKNQPDLSKVYSTIGGVEGVIGSLYRTYHQATQGGNGEGLSVQSKVMALESYGQVANFGMALRGGIPRIFINNQRANAVAPGNVANWSTLSRLMRSAATVAQVYDNLTAAGKTTGSISRDQRMRAFAYFVNGIAMGTLALGYDSVAIATPATPVSAIPDLMSPDSALAMSMRILDTAIILFRSTTGPDGGVPAAWLGGVALDTAGMVRLIRTYKAKLRAAIARTPAQRAAVDWVAVAADAAAGITANHVISLNGATGWTSGVDASTFQTSASWHQISMIYSGMADTSGAYQAFIAQPMASRDGMAVLVRTPDTRWPSGATRALQNANTTLPLAAGKYISNRASGGDQPDNSNPWGTSQYDHRRYYTIQTAAGIGPMAFITYAEIAMLRAEALLAPGAQNNPATAMALVNTQRATAGLPPFATPGSLAPGTTGCVPRLPDNTCGTLREAMKYEKRMETQLTGYMQWFLDSRGWGDLPLGTSLHWPVPYQEMDARNLPFYNMPFPGAAGANLGAGPSSYVAQFGF